jgi:hypothetical protein
VFSFRIGRHWLGRGVLRWFSLAILDEFITQIFLFNQFPCIPHFCLDNKNNSGIIQFLGFLV